MRERASLRLDRSPQWLVEHCTSVGGPDLQFSVYDTYRPPTSVTLHARNLLYCGMISGRKRVHTRDQAPFDFVPGESLVVPAGQSICIDFPETVTGAPTTGITLEIEGQKVQQIVDRLNESAPRSPESGPRTVRNEYVHFLHPPAIEHVLRTIVALFVEGHEYRDVLIDLNATELIVRLLQTDARELLLAHPSEVVEMNGLAAAVKYVHDNLDGHISVDDLADAACMSRSTFYRYFRAEFGVTPLQYVNNQRMERAQRLLRDPERSVTGVSYDLGFRSVSHFIKTFKAYVGTTPKAYQSRMSDNRKVEGL